MARSGSQVRADSGRPDPGPADPTPGAPQPVPAAVRVPGFPDNAPAAWESIVDSIGPKVRELRQALGLSLQQLASRSDVSAAAIHKVERGDMVPTITTLLKLATALDRPIGHFVDEQPAEVPVACHVPAKARPPLQPPAPGIEPAGIAGPPHRFRAAGAVITVEPGAVGGAPLAPRTGEDLVLVLEGTLAFEVAGEHYSLRRGDSLHYPTDRRYRFSNPGRRPARAVWFSLRG